MGHQVTVFAPTYSEQKEEENVFRYATLLHRFIGGIVIPNPFDRRIEKEFREKHFDVIHVHHPMLVGRTAAYLSRKYHIPMVFTYHTRYEKYVECYTKGLLRVEKLMPFYLHPFLKRCSFVFAPTEGIRTYLTDTLGMEQERTGVLPTGIEERNFQVRFMLSNPSDLYFYCACRQIPCAGNAAVSHRIQDGAGKERWVSDKQPCGI